MHLYPHTPSIEKHKDYINMSKMALDVKLTKLMLQLADHIEDDDIHVTPEDKERWNNMLPREEFDAFVEALKEKLGTFMGDDNDEDIDDWGDDYIITLRRLELYLTKKGYLTKEEIIELIQNMFGEGDFSQFLTEAVANGIYVRKDEFSKYIKQYVSENPDTLKGEKGDKGDKGDKGEKGDPGDGSSVTIVRRGIELDPDIVLVPVGENLLDNDVFDLTVKVYEQDSLGNKTYLTSGTNIALSFATAEGDYAKTKALQNGALRVKYEAGYGDFDEMLGKMQDQNITRLHISTTIDSVQYWADLNIVYGDTIGLTDADVRDIIDSEFKKGGNLRLSTLGTVAQNNTEIGLVWKGDTVSTAKDRVGEGGGSGSSLVLDQSISYFVISAEKPTVPTTTPNTSFDDIRNGIYTWTHNQPNDAEVEEGYYVWWVWIARYSDGSYSNWFGPVRISGGTTTVTGADGTDIEFIYARAQKFPFVFASPSDPADWTNDDGFQNDDYINPSYTTMWYDNPQGIDQTNKYEYVSVRTKKDKVWSAFTSPVLWSAYGDKGGDGKDGDGVEYIYYLNYIPETSPNPEDWYDDAESKAGYADEAYYTTPDGKYSTNRDDTGQRPFNSTEWIAAGTNWTDNPSGVQEPGDVEYVSVRKYRNDVDPTSSETEDAYWHQYSKPTIWSYYAKDALADGAAQFDDSTINLGINDNNKNVALASQKYSCSIYMTTGPAAAGEVVFAGLYEDGVEIKSVPSGLHVTGNTGSVTISIDENTFEYVVGKQRKLKFKVWKSTQDSTNNPDDYRIAYITLTMVKTGSDGDAGVSYKLKLSNTCVFKGVGTSIGTLVPSTVSVSAVKTTGISSFDEKSAGSLWSDQFRIIYQLDGSTEVTKLTTSTFSTSTGTDSNYIIFSLQYQPTGSSSWQTIDSATLWYVQNGTNGINTCTYDMVCNGGIAYDTTTSKYTLQIDVEVYRSIGNLVKQQPKLLQSSMYGFKSYSTSDVTYPQEVTTVICSSFDGKDSYALSPTYTRTGGSETEHYYYKLDKDKTTFNVEQSSMIVTLMVGDTAVVTQTIPVTYVTTQPENGTSPIMFYSNNNSIILDNDSNADVVKSMTTQTLFLYNGSSPLANSAVKVVTAGVPTGAKLYDATNGSYITANSTCTTDSNGRIKTYWVWEGTSDIPNGVYETQYSYTSGSSSLTVAQTVTVKDLTGAGVGYSLNVTPSAVLFTRTSTDTIPSSVTVDGSITMSYMDNTTDGKMVQYTPDTGFSIVSSLNVTVYSALKYILYTDGITVQNTEGALTFSEIKYKTGYTLTWYAVNDLGTTSMNLSDAIAQGKVVALDSQSISVTLSGTKGESGDGTSPVMFYSNNVNVILDSDSNDATIKAATAQDLYVSVGEDALIGAEISVDSIAVPDNSGMILRNNFGQEITVNSKITTYSTVQAGTYWEYNGVGDIPLGQYQVTLKYTHNTYDYYVTQTVTVKALSGLGEFYSVNVTPGAVLFTRSADTGELNTKKTGVTGKIILSCKNNNTEGEIKQCNFVSDKIYPVRNLTSEVSTLYDYVLYTDGISTTYLGGYTSCEFDTLTYKEEGYNITWYAVSHTEVKTLEQIISDGEAVILDTQPIGCIAEGPKGATGSSSTETTTQHVYKNLKVLKYNYWGNSTVSKSVYNGVDDDGKEVQNIVIWDGFAGSNSDLTQNTNDKSETGVAYFGAYLCKNSCETTWNNIPTDKINFDKMDYDFSVFTSYLYADEGFISKLSTNQITVYESNEDSSDPALVGGMTSSKGTTTITTTQNGTDVAVTTTPSKDNVIIWAGKMADNTNNLYSAPFYVTDSGRVVAEDAELEGTVIVTSTDNDRGKLPNAGIVNPLPTEAQGTYGLMDTTPDKQYVLDESGDIVEDESYERDPVVIFSGLAGGDDINSDASFKVRQSGKLEASDASIEGDITATSLTLMHDGIISMKFVTYDKRTFEDEGWDNIITYDSAGKEIDVKEGTPIGIIYLGGIPTYFTTFQPLSTTSAAHSYSQITNIYSVSSSTNYLREDGMTKVSNLYWRDDEKVCIKSSSTEGDFELFTLSNGVYKYCSSYIVAAPLVSTYDAAVIPCEINYYVPITITNGTVQEKYAGKAYITGPQLQAYGVDYRWSKLSRAYITSPVNDSNTSSWGTSYAKLLSSSNAIMAGDVTYSTNVYTATLKSLTDREVTYTGSNALYMLGTATNMYSTSPTLSRPDLLWSAKKLSSNKILINTLSNVAVKP